MGISLDMPKSPKDIDFTIILILLGLWNQEMPSFLKMTSSVEPRNTVPAQDYLEPSTSSDKLAIIHNTPQVPMSVEQLITEVPQIAENNPGDQVAQELPETVEELVEQHAP